MTRSPGPTHKPRCQGRVWLIVVAVVGVLLLVAAALFHLWYLKKKIERLEKRASEEGLSELPRLDSLTSSALDRAIARLYEDSLSRAWTFYSNTPWLYRLKTEPGALAHGRAHLDDDRVGEWVTHAQFADRALRSKTKIIDCAAQINLNGRQDTLARMLDHLGEAIERSARLKRDRRLVTNPFYERPKRGGRRIRGKDILLLRQRLDGQRFRSKTELKRLIGSENYEIVKDFLTCHSWEDPHTWRAADGLNEVPDLALGLISPVPGGSVVRRQPAAFGVRLEHEPRHPINVNTAPEEVLVACLQGLAGRRLFPYSRLGLAPGVDTVEIDRDAGILGERVIGTEEVGDVGPRPVFVYSSPLTYDHALRIAQVVIQQRKDPRRFFRAWRTNDPAQPGFEDFVDALDPAFFPNPATVHIIDPDQPQNRKVRAHILAGGGTPLGRLWLKGNAQGAERALRRSLGLNVHTTHAWYYDMMKGILKANFNPNTRINRYNPNAPAYVPVDKSDLVWYRADERQLRKGHTTELCFDPMGVFEITTLGEIEKKATPRGAAVGDSLSWRKVRTVVQIYDVLRHTNQFHFARTFDTGAMSSSADRKYVVTWPEPLNALTELFSQGSRRDGRVELIGFLDGMRDRLPIPNRHQSYGKHPAVLMEMGFFDLDPESQLRLKSALRGGGRDEVRESLLRALDADYSRYRKTYRRAYRTRDLLALGAFSRDAVKYNEPAVNRELLGTDLLPDGFSTSLTRIPHLANRTVVVPARQRIGDVSFSDGDVRVGASGRATRGQNVMGNVPYYRGGIAFWVKFEFNGDDPVFSGLIGCTQVIKQVVPAAQNFTGSEGTQFFIFRNTAGQLRIVRLYYHQAFPTPGKEGGVSLHPTIGSGAEGYEDRQKIKDELDPQKWISRSDILVDARHFRAHEWHHIAVDWNDQDVAFPIKLYIDFQEAREGGTPRRPQTVVDGKANSWVCLNEIQPKDGLQIGGIVRHQAVPDAGVFKWFTNTAAVPRLVTTVAPSVKRILANATIDELITYDGTFPTARSFYSGSAQPGYFTPMTGEYANVFEVPVPPTTESVVLRSLDWTAYYPTTYSDSQPDSRPHQLEFLPLECQVHFLTDGALPEPFQDPWRRPAVANPLAGRRVHRPAEKTAEHLPLVYKFHMNGARSRMGNTAGGVVQTPVLDDVTLTYFPPTPRMLHEE